jgi:hypothetical protein
MGVSPADYDTPYLSYYLPKRTFVLSFVRTFAQSSEFRARAAAKAAYDAAEVAYAQAELEYQHASAAHTADPSDPDLRKESVRLSAIRTWRDSERTRTKAALANANAAWQQTRTLANGCGLDDAFTLTPAAYVPDTSKKLFAVFDHRVWRNDTFALTTTTSGLLSNGTATASDQSSAVAQGFARLLALPAAVDIARPSQISARTADLALLKDVTLEDSKKEDRKDDGSKDSPDSQCLAMGPFEFEMTIDPTEKSDLSAFSEALGEARAWYEMRITEFGTQAEVAKGTECALAPGAGKNPSTAPGGLFHRRNRSVVLRAYAYDPNRQKGSKCELAHPMCKLAHSIVIDMPNASSCEFVAYDAGALTDSVNTTTFENGMLTTLTSTRPSELVAALSLPIEVVRAPLSLVKDLLTLRIDYADKRAALLESEIELRKQSVLMQEAERGYFGGTPPTRPVPDPKPKGNSP